MKSVNVRELKNNPSAALALSQAVSAEKAWPKWSGPVGEGAKRPR